MLHLYSTLIANERALVGDSGPLSPPPGYVWVIRDITITAEPEIAGVSASVTGADGTTIAAASLEGVTGQDYWHETGRWFVESPENGGFIQLHATFPCDFYISGYALSAP